MRLSVEEIRKIARLARLELTPEEESRYAAQLAEVVTYIDQLERLAVEGAAAPAPEGVERRDDPVAGLALEDWLDNAPAALDRFVLVPQVKRSE
ncbi:MAG TPA: Asp-tRNA(Asn)/Glu-tRNA(Gln) amidotransferase subunit GatC [Thermoanaerobaculia bacterium]|nr:Asp-tRNA(Asn)/Glu-tRNA(Gln) amidotransferase subunit GatC [Thermoanaerobaculia bacterium]